MAKTVKQVSKTTKTAAEPAKASPAKAEAVAPAKVEAAAPAPAKAVAPAAEPTTSSVATDLTAVLDQLTTLRNTIATLQTAVRNLQKEHAKEVRTLTKAATKKTKRAPDANRAPSGFAKPSQLSDKLCSFLGVTSGTQMPRTEVTRKISAYIKAQNLQKQADKKFFTPDNKMKVILSPLEGDHKTNGYSFFNLQKYIKHNFTKVEATAWYASYIYTVKNNRLIYKTSCAFKKTCKNQ